MAERFCSLALVLGLLCSLAMSSHDEFMRGISSVGFDNKSTDLLKHVGAQYARQYVFWNAVEPRVDANSVKQWQRQNVSVATIKSNVEEWVYRWSKSVDWSVPDARLVSLRNVGVTALPEIGEGTVFGIPKFTHNDTYLDPSVIGTQLYLALQYRFCRAAVHRYVTQNAIVNITIAMWQIENELNEAFLSGFYGQRVQSAIWGDWGFLTELLATLRASVKDESPSSMVTMNFHTDVPKSVHDYMGMKGYFVQAIADWASLLDVIALDAYPNMYVAHPILSEVVGERVSIALNVTNHSQRVFIMETGYPVNAPLVSNATTPAVFNATQGSQAEYITRTYDAVRKRGGSGFFYFDLEPTPGMVRPRGGFTLEDATLFEAVGKVMATGKLQPLIDWVVRPGSLGEIEHRAGLFFHRPHDGWGLIDAAMQPRKAYFELQSLYT